MKDKNKIGFNSKDTPNVTPKQAFGLCQKGAAIIDIRPDYMTAYKKFKVKEVLYFPRNRGELSCRKLDKTKIYIVAESSASVHSREAAKKMMDACGFSDVYNLAGGILEWERDELPLDVDKKARLSGSCTCQLKYRG